jgi:2-keto-myo-inositol isomerase
VAPNVQLCLSETRVMNTSLEEDVRAASEAGFTCLDLWAPKLDEYLASYPVTWLDARLREHRVYAVAVSGMEPLSLYASEEQLVIQAHYLELCVRLDALGGGIVVVHPGACPEAESTAWMVRALRDLSNLAAPFEVRLAFELRADASSSTCSLALSQEIVQRVARSNVCLALSTFHFHQSGGQPEDLEALDIARLRLVHLEGLSDLPLGVSGDEGALSPDHDPIPLEAICRRLAAKGFRGPYCVEWPAGQHPLVENARLAHQTALDLLTGLYAQNQKPGLDEKNLVSDVS